MAKMQIQETKIKDLTVEELRNIIRETVLETLESYQDDLEENLTIKKDVEQQLLAIKKRRDSKKTSISASEVYKQLGIND